MKPNFQTLCVLAVFAIAVMAAPIGAKAADGPVVLTVAGNVTHPNRGPVDPFVDAFFNNAAITFDKAATFSVKDLEAIGMKTLTVRYPDWPKGFTFEGPLLKDVLAKAGASGTTVRVQALDGYSAEIPMADVQRYPVVLAIKRDGQYLGIGDRGPAWVVFPRDDYPELQSQDDARWVWAAYYIHVE